MKDKVVAGLLAIFLGGIGVHKFYLNRVGQGVIYLLFCWTMIPSFISFIEGIVYLAMSKDGFDRKYNYVALLEDELKYERQKKRGKSKPDYKPKKQRKVDKETKTSTTKFKQARPKSNPYRSRGTQLYKEYDFDGALKAYRKSLEIQANDPYIHFNTACLYSLLEDPQDALFHLDKAVEQGFNDFERIRTHNHLAHLRIQAEYDDFVKRGYRLTPQLSAQTEQPVLDLATDVINKLEKLVELRDKGVLTENEFLQQKSKILRP